MPIYDFLCPACGHRFEKLVKMNELPACPECEHAQAERQLALSAGISTGRTRSKAAASGRRIASARKDEQNRAHAEYLRKHDEDHH